MEQHISQIAVLMEEQTLLLREQVELFRGQVERAERMEAASLKRFEEQSVLDRKNAEFLDLQISVFKTNAAIADIQDLASSITARMETPDE